jgi:hypothetical protein
MQQMQQGKDGGCGASGAVIALLAVIGLALVALATNGCSTGIQTPLPDLKSAASTSLTEEERKKAVEELNRKRATHEQDAEQEIERAR